MRRVRGAGEDPDCALRSPTRYLAIAGALVVGATGLLLGLAVAFAPLDPGETRSPTVIATGLVLTTLAAAYAVTQRGSARRPLPPAQPRPGGVALPVRRGHRAAGGAAFLAVAAWGVVLAVGGGSAGPRLTGGVLVLGGAGLALVWQRSDPRILLDPTGLTLPGSRAPLAWDDVHDVAALGGWLPALAVGASGRRLVTARLAGQAWPPSTLVAVLDHYRSEDGRADRGGLDRTASLDRFRGT
ncbi:hypothetical protein [Nocardioides lijunqiniae]|uniref:hypothetical protein n=1 Tax=Nocardioides lijunqiniae TaxID=2760832 RepID=UPI001878C88C|nr:hypothetical protein [Nocardioides lijunqiniae]